VANAKCSGVHGNMVGRRRPPKSAEEAQFNIFVIGFVLVSLSPPQQDSRA
jgi:hypothetical protein